MTLKGAVNPSLRWQLSWQLSVVFTIVVGAVIVGLCAYGAIILSPTVGLKEQLRVALNEAIVRNPQGGIAVVEGPYLKAFREENNKLWFVAAAPDHAIAVYGTVPAPYVELSRFVPLLKDADIRGAKDVDEVASVDGFQTAIGEVRVMYGGNTNKVATFLTMLIYLYPIYIPLLVIALPAIFLTVPRVVRHALSGLSSVVRKAPEIDPRRGGSRLPVNDVPMEVVPLIVAFNSILERLEEQFRSRQRFLVDAAHELRTPIAIMQTRIEGMTPGQERKRLMDDVGRLGETAEQLLDFERTDQATDRHQSVDLVSITRKVVADLAPLAIAAGYEISFECELGIIERQGSPTTLPRAIANLVRNAIDHGGNHGAILVSVSANGQIAVSDEGPGIPSNQREQIFEPFYRIKPRSQGAGLGLSLVKQIVANHHGQVTVDGKATGIIFTLHL